jgi:large subunit ribosomal protein L6
MSRFGKSLVKIPEDVKVELTGGEIVVSGPKGTVKRTLPTEISIDIKDGSLFVLKRSETKRANSIQGTIRAHILNMIKGVKDGWSKTLEIVGAGYRAELKGDTLSLSIGYSNPVEVKIPPEVSVKIEKSLVTLEGADKELVGQLAADIRAKRKPEPYKGSGIKYQDEVIRRKAGKQAAVKSGTI